MPTCDVDELIHVMQAFRSKENKLLYMRLRQTLIDRKSSLFPKENLTGVANAIFMFATSKPRKFGIYQNYADEEIDELLAHYEHDLCDAAENADAETLTRIATAMYVLRSDQYENVWWRIENRTNELA